MSTCTKGRPKIWGVSVFWVLYMAVMLGEVWPCYCLYLEIKYDLRTRVWVAFWQALGLWWFILCVNLEGVLDAINTLMNCVWRRLFSMCRWASFNQLKSWLEHKTDFPERERILQPTALSATRVFKLLDIRLGTTPSVLLGPELISIYVDFKVDSLCNCVSHFHISLSTYTHIPLVLFFWRTLSNT